MTGVPLFSVVIPTYARPRALAACLDGLAALDFPRDRFEVIVADDGSPSPLETVVATFQDRLTIALITHANTGPAAARNRGAACARGTYLAFLDDDCIPGKDWLSALASRFGQFPDHLVAGRSANALPLNPYSSATQLIVSYVHDYSARRADGVRLFNTTNMSVSTRLFRDLGGFSGSMRTSEDYDFCSRWQHAGYHITYAPEAVVHHAHVLTFTTFCLQHFHYGRGLLRYRMAAGDRASPRREPFSFYVNLLRFPLTQGRGARSWFHAALVALSQAATAAGIIRELVAPPRPKQRSSSPAQERGGV
jgi:GT2 family glycosyltransferase